MNNHKVFVWVRSHSPDSDGAAVVVEVGAGVVVGNLVVVGGLVKTTGLKVCAKKSGKVGVAGCPLLVGATVISLGPLVGLKN